MAPRKRPTTPATVEAYIAALPADRGRTIEAVVRLVRKHLPKGYDEMIGFGMINWGISLERYPQTYNGQPVCYVALAAQKNYSSLYLMSVYGSTKIASELADAYKSAGKKLDIGKSCLRFKTIDDLVPGAVGKAIGALTPVQWRAIYERSHPPKATGVRPK